MIYLPTWMVGFFGGNKLVGKYTVRCPEFFCHMFERCFTDH